MVRRVDRGEGDDVSAVRCWLAVGGEVFEGVAGVEVFGSFVGLGWGWWLWLHVSSFLVVWFFGLWWLGYSVL